MTTDIGIKLRLDGAQQVQTDLRGVGGAMQGLGASAASLKSAVATLGGAFAGIAGVREFVAAADSVTRLQNSLQLATGSARAAKDAYESLFEIAQRSRVSFIELGGTFASIANAAGELGVSQQRLLTVTEAIGNAVTISGASAQASQAALVQLSQGLASGTLRGDELNSVLEQTPRLAQAIADGMGVARGELRKLGEQGSITAEQVIQALESQSARLAKEVSSAVLTVGQAFTQLQSATVKFVGEADQASGATSMIAEALTAVTAQLKELEKNTLVMDALRVAGQAVYVLFTDIAFVLSGIGREFGGVAAQVAAVTRGDWGAVRSIRQEMLADAQRARADLDARQARVLAPRTIGEAMDTSAEDARLARMTRDRARALKEEEQAAKDLMAIKMRLSGVTQQYFDDQKKLQELQAAGRITQQEYVRLMGELANKTFKGADSAKAAATAVDQQAQNYTQLIERIRERISAQTLENAVGDKLAESQRIRLQLDRDVALGKIKATDASKAQTQALLDELAASEKAGEALRRRAAEADSIADFLRAQDEAASAALRSVNDRIESLENEERAVALAAQQNISLSVAIEKVAIARLRERQAGFVNGSEGYERLEREIAARERILELVSGKAQREATERAAKEAAEAWKRTADSIENSLTDALLRGFESGKDFARNFRDTVANMFRTLILRPVISAIVSPVAMGITSLLGLGSPVAMAAGGGGMGGLAGVGNLLSGVTTLMGGLGSTVAGAVGSAVGAIFGTGVGNVALGTSLGLGAASSTAAATAAAAAGGASTAGISTAGSMLGTVGSVIGPLVLGIAALTALMRATRGESRSGGQYAYVFDDGVLTNNRRGTSTITDQRGAVYLEGAGFGAGKYDDDAVKQAINGTVGTIGALLKGLGSSLTITAFQAGFETSGKGRGGVFAGGRLSNGATFGESGQGDNYAGTLFEQTSTQSPDMKTALENFSLDLKQATIQALQAATDIPRSIKDRISKVDAEALTNEAADALLLAINEQIQGVQKLRGAFDAMNLGDLADIAFDTAAALAQAAGGFDKLLGNLDRFYQNFYTDEERRANLQRQVDKEFDRLGIAKPQGREGFRTLVEDTLRRADEQQAGRQQLVAALIKDPSSLISGGGQANFDRLAGYGGLNAEFLGNAAADPARREALSAFMSDLGDVFRAGKTPAEIEASVSDLVRANSAVLGMGEDAAATAAALLNVSDAFAELNESAEQVAQRQRAERDKALQALQRAVAEERDVLRARIDAARETVENLRGIFDLLATSIKELRAEAIGPAANATIGQAFITQALATARATGYLPEREQLADAIGAARGGLGLENFASVAEQRFAQLRLAGELEALQQLAGEQLSDAERLQRTAEAQLEALEETLKYWEKQVRIANEGVQATLSVKDAILALTGKMFPETAGEATGSGSGSGSGGFVIGGGGGAGNPSKPGSGFFGAGGTEINDPTAVARFTSIRDFTRTLDFGDGNKGASVGALAQAANAYGVDYREIAIANGYRPEDVARLFEEYGYTVPKFAVGTNYVPRDMLAMVHKGEAIVPAPYNPAANPGMAGNSSEQRATREEITALRRQMDQLIFEMRRTANATNGNPEAPTLVKLA